MNRDFIVFGAPDIREQEINEVVHCLRSGWLGTGPKVAKFEQNFAEYKGLSPHLVAAVNSCTAALHVSMIAAGIQPGDEVITTAMTFCATVNAIIHAGGTPVLVDIDPMTMNIDPDQIKRRINSRTRAIVIVHFAGRPCAMDSIVDIAKQHRIKLIEDCAHAIETEYNGRKSGTFGDFGCFSFYVTKNVVTGEGGMVVAKREEDIARIKMLALHGMSNDAWRRFSDTGYKHYQVLECGFKYNMMDLQAAIGIHQLARIETSWQRRREIWEYYQRALSDLPIFRPKGTEASIRHAYHLYTVQLDKDHCPVSRDEFLERMTKLGIGIGVHYLAIPEHLYYQQQYGWIPDDYPVAVHAGRQTVSLPISAALTNEDVERIAHSVHTAILQ